MVQKNKMKEAKKKKRITKEKLLVAFIKFSHEKHNSVLLL